MTLDLFTVLQQGLAKGEFSAEILASNAIKHITNSEHKINAIIHYNWEITLDMAKKADIRLNNGERNPMLGIPFIIKDNIHIKGMPVSNGSKIMSGYIAPYNATVIERLLQAGAVPIAKANMDEFAMGSSGEYSAFNPTKNPWNIDCVPGGSSSGSAAAIAAGYVPFALGSDTGGSVRLPGSFCNVTAMRPTYGALSRYGATALASSLDQIGPMSTSASGIAAGFSIMSGIDIKDATSIDLKNNHRLSQLKPANLRGLKIGLPKEYYVNNIKKTTQELIDNALILLQEQGANIVEVSLPHTEYAIDAYYIINASEAYSNLARFDGIRYGDRKFGNSISEMIMNTRSCGFGREVKRRILLGAFCLSKGHSEMFYFKALKVRTLIMSDFQKAFQDVDILITPMYPDVAFSLNEKVTNPLDMYLADIFTVTSSLASLPAISIPIGFYSNMPIGMQLIGPQNEDVKVLEIAHAFQQLTDYHTKMPAII